MRVRLKSIPAPQNQYHTPYCYFLLKEFISSLNNNIACCTLWPTNPGPGPKHQPWGHQPLLQLHIAQPCLTQELGPASGPIPSLSPSPGRRPMTPAVLFLAGVVGQAFVPGQVVLHVPTAPDHVNCWASQCPYSFYIYLIKFKQTATSRKDFQSHPNLMTNFHKFHGSKITSLLLYICTFNVHIIKFF